MTLQLVDPQRVDPNPYQPASRSQFTPADLADLESIREVGLLQIPQARPAPSPAQGEGRGEGGRYQLKFGHRRRAGLARSRLVV